MKKLENIILYGAGKNIYIIINYLNKRGGFEVKEIWDSNPHKVGKIFWINHKEVPVCLPEDGFCDMPILITSDKYEKEIREQLINSCGIKKQNIKNWRYCFQNIREEILANEICGAELKNIDIEHSEFVIEKDMEIGLLYSWWKGRKIFFKRSICQEHSAKAYLCAARNEQKLISSYCYCQKGFEITEKDVIVDGKAAEGFFALENIDKAKKIFLVEGDEEWIEALQETFRPYPDKVIIVPKRLGGVMDNHTVTIDYLNKKEKITFMKLDNAGEETAVLEGAKKTLQRNKNIKVIACMYRNFKETDILGRQFLGVGFATYFSEDYMFYPYGEIVQPMAEKLKGEISREIDWYKLQVENMPYELGMGDAPKIQPAEKLLEKILRERKSLCRFGDGEFEMMRGNERPWFQNPDERLAKRLKEVINTEEENVLVAVADNFGNLDKYTDEAANSIRYYLNGGTRNAVIDILDLENVYYDAYVSRPYIMYRDKSRSIRIFALFKKIWQGRNILIVEGEYSRLGVGNDLFSTANKVRRILCPSQNAFNQYETILTWVLREADKNDLVVISLGPTATVMAYDIAKSGIQALDIGQLDNEYEWHLMGAQKRENIPGKGVAEMEQCHEAGEMDDIQYYDQIVARIENIVK